MMSKRILVIDDEEAIRKSFLLALEDTGYQVDTAESGERGLELQKNTGYDLIFLDLKMPGLNGVETLRELRKMDGSVPVYIVTAFHGEFLDQLKSVEEDGIGFEVLRKPIGADEIVLLAKSILEGPVVH
ncbi:response regulator [Thermodesulfobacteriota bacterium]